MVQRKTFLSRLDVLAIVGVLGLAAIFVLPRLRGVRMAHNETSAVHALKVLRERMIELKDRRSGPSPTAELTPRNLIVREDGTHLLDDSRFLDQDGETLLQRHGYYFAVRYAPGSVGPREGYTLFGWPVRPGQSGRVSYKASAAGHLYENRSQHGALPPRLSQTRSSSPSGTTASQGAQKDHWVPVSWEDQEPLTTRP